ncbi:MAG: FG-GAP-like repeat-containing protein [Planctomycetaceae bacterium]
MSSGSSRFGLWFGLATLAVLIIGVLAWFKLGTEADDPGADAAGGETAAEGKTSGGSGVATRPLSVDEYAGAYEFANTGLGHLENLELLKAETTFRALMQKVPGERLPLQNLAIAQTIIASDDNSDVVKNRSKPGGTEVFEQAVASARETLEDLETTDKALANMLGGLITVREGDVESGIVQLKAAADLEPSNASYWFALYKAHANLALKPGAPPEPLAIQAIEKVYELEPENLHAIAELLQVQGKAKSDKLAGTLTAAKDVIRPLAPSIQSRARFDILKIMDDAITDLRNGGTRGSVRARQIANVLKPDIAKRIDQRNLDKNLLEYVMVEFGSEFDQQAAKVGYEIPVDDAINVSFKRMPGFPQISGATDVKLADMNLDGTPDLVVVQNGSIRIYGQQRSSEEEPKWVQAASFELEGFEVQSVALADFDRDYEKAAWREKKSRIVHNGIGLPPNQVPAGVVFTDTDLDVVAYGSSGVMVLRNDRATEGDGPGFKRKLSRIAFPDDEQENLAGVRDVAITDIEHDGDLDIVVGLKNKLSFWVNQSTSKEMKFANGDASIGSLPDGESVTGLEAVDWNRDIANDIVVVTDRSVGLMQNVLHSRFRWRDMGIETGGQSVAVGELNGNAVWDLLIGTEKDVAVHLASPATEEATTWLTGSRHESSANVVELLDYDNDTYQDVLVGGKNLSVLRGVPSGKFTSVNIIESPASDVSAIDVADIDLDGDADFVAVTDGEVVVYENDGGNKNNWFRLTLRADPNPEQFPSNRVSMHAVGSVLELKSGARYQAKLVQDQTTLFGLGSRDQADVMRIIFTDGVPQNIVDQPLPEKSLTVFAPQYLGGSCPYIYTWNGERFTFYSDCLWAAPLGLQQAEGVFAPAREWEYIRIDGNSLKSRDDQYVLKMTEELWEATYLDEVKLIAVDHPVGTEIYSNEKVGPPNVTEFKIHGVKEPKLPIAATDQNGRDLLPLLRDKDKQYVRAFDTRIKQGLTNQHFIELDLGDIENPDNVKLFLVGWVFPTDTNINIGIDQTGEAPPKPPAIMVPDENGEWVEAVPFAGFPGGKTKTIAIDLSNAFKAKDYRVRVVTSMELYWDAAFFTDGEQSVDTRRSELPLRSAELQFRGFSKRRFHGSVFSTVGFGPEDYDYEDVSTRPTWLPMDGHFTRYGDVTELLTDRDDMQVVFGAGDEVTLRFDAASADVPDGYVRDFLLYNVGWDKDVKQNTVYGSTVEPLPYQGMKSYTAADTAFPDTQKHREFLRTWQTRRQNFRVFRNWVREFDTSGRKSSE